MKKSLGKVASLILAAAMITSSFSATFSASAATKRETGSLSFAGTGLSGDDDTIYLASNEDSQMDTEKTLEDWLGAAEIETYDHDTMSGDFVSISHASGDSLVKIDKDDDTLIIKKNVSGKEVITVTYEAEYERDDNDVTVRAKKDITIYAQVDGSYVLGSSASDVKEDKDISSAAVNEDVLFVGIYKITADANQVMAVDVNADDIAVEISSSSLKKNSSIFDHDYNGKDDGQWIVDNTTAAGIPFPVKLNSDGYAKKTGTESYKIKLNDDKSYTTYKLTVAKKWNAVDGVEVGKKNGKTYIETVPGSIDFEDDSRSEIEEAGGVAITGYEVNAAGSITVNSGSLGNITAPASATVTIEDGTVGDIKAGTVAVNGGSVGTIKDRATDIDIEDGKVKSIDAKKADVSITGGTIGDVVGNVITINAEDEDVKTVVGNVTVKNSDAEGSITIGDTNDASIAVGNIKLASGDFTVTGDNVTVGTIDVDYRENNVNFDDFDGSITGLKNADNATVALTSETKLALADALTAGTINVDTDTKLTAPSINVEIIEGDGTLAFPAGKLFIEDSISDEVTFQLTEGLAAGVTAFTCYSDAVDEEDFIGLGFDAEQKVATDDTDKFVVKSVYFAGLSFDKTAVEVAKGYETTITVANYPAGTKLPEGASIEWSFDGNDDYIQVTTDEAKTTATIKVVDYNADYATDNTATVTATVVDANGNEYDDYVAAECKVTGTALPSSTVTLDTTTVTVGKGGIYQFIAKSSTDAVMTAATSDAQIATVALYDAKDARGYKFQVNAIAEGKATITVTDANGAVATMEVTVAAVNGSIKADTTSIKMAPGAIYDVKLTVTGSDATPVVTCPGNVAAITSIGDGKYRITARNAGTAWMRAEVNGVRVSVTIVVEAGATLSGVTGNNVTNF